MKQLIKQALAGNNEAFVSMMELNMQSMYKTAWVYLKNDEDVADAVQDTILTCYEKLYTLQNPKYFKTWMTRILINKCNDMLKKRRRYELDEALPERGAVEEHYADCEWKAVLSRLPEKYQQVLSLYYIEGLSTKEISRVLEINLNTVLTRLARAKKKLRAEYFFDEAGCTLEPTFSVAGEGRL